MNRVGQVVVREPALLGDPLRREEVPEALARRGLLRKLDDLDGPLPGQALEQQVGQAERHTKTLGERPLMAVRISRSRSAWRSTVTRPVAGRCSSFERSLPEHAAPRRVKENYEGRLKRSRSQWVAPIIALVPSGGSGYAIEDRGSERVLRVQGREHHTYYSERLIRMLIERKGIERAPLYFPFKETRGRHFLERLFAYLAARGSASLAVLEVGCSFGHITEYLNDQPRVAVIDTFDVDR